MNEVLNLENIVVDKVKALCAKNPAYETMLREVIKADQICENPGFQFKDMQTVSGGHINAMVQAGLIIKSYESNNYTHWRLAVPREELESILDDIEIARLESEKARLQAARPAAQALLSPELIKEFEDLVKTEPDLLAYWATWINPKIDGMIAVKKALLLCMASHGDRWGDRGRIHVLLYGSLGGAKSVLMEWIVFWLSDNFFGSLSILSNSFALSTVEASINLCI